MKVNGLLIPQKWKATALLMLVIVLSIVVRVPNLDRPLSKHHEFCTALTLQILKSWEQEGIAQFQGNPALNFSNPNDKYINNYGSLADEKGNYYYLSHPPLAYYLPYVFFQALDLKADVLSLQVFNLIVNLVSSLLVFLLISRLIPRNDEGRWWRALIAASIYLMMPSVLWFQGNVYMSDIVVFMFYLLALYLFVRLQTEGGKLLLILHSLAVFLMVYTSWLGVFYTVSMVILSVIFRKKINWTYNLWAVFASTFALGLMILQYSQIQGFTAYFDYLMNRLSARGSFADSGEESFLGRRFHEFILIAQNLLSSYLPHILALITLFLFWKKGKGQVTPEWKGILIRAILPLALLHLSLMNYAGHDFVQLPWSIVLVLFLLPWIDLSKGTLIVCSALLFSSLLLYFYVNRPGQYSIKGDAYSSFQLMANEISRESVDDEVVFISGQFPEPQLIYYAERNLCFVAETEDILQQMKNYQTTRGVLFQINKESQQIDRVLHFDIGRDTLAHELILAE